MAGDVNTREACSPMETENAAAANDNVADVNPVGAVAAGELNGASELLALLNDGDEQATNADFASGELKANIAQKTLLSTSNLMQPLKFPLAHKGKLLFFPKKCTAADENEELSIRARVQLCRQKLIGVQQPHKQLENFETEMKPVENKDFPFRRPNFGTKFPVKYTQSLQCLWPKAQTPTSHNEVAMKKTSNKKLNLESCRKLCEKKANISDKSTIEQQVEPNNDFRTRFQGAEMFSATKTASKPMLTFASSSSSLDIAVTTQDADSNNEHCIKSGSDICLATQLTHSSATNVAISSTTADSKFPLMHSKHGYSDKFPLGSRLVKPQAPHHANIVDLSTLPLANLRQQCINNNNNAVKKNFPHAHSHFPTALKGAVCTSFPLTHSTAMPPTLISVYNVENQNSNISAAENNTDIAATMTQSEIFHINRTAHHVRENTPLALETHTETSANTQQAQRHTQNDAGGGDGSNNVLPKIFAKNTQICKQPSESSKFDGHSTENLTDAAEERPHRAAITPPVCGAATGARAPRERARAETDTAGDSIPSDSGHTNFHNLSQPPTTLHAASSDVRDTSSQEVLLLVAANVSAALETCTATENASATPNPVPTPTSARPPAAAPSNSPNLAFLSDCAENASVAAHEFDKSDKAVVIANNNNHKNNGENINNQHKNNSETNKNNNHKNNSVINAKNNDESNNTNNHVNDSPSNAKNGDIDNSADVVTPHIHLQDAAIGVRGDFEMTLTKVEDSEEDNLSVSSSVVDDIQKLSDIDQPADDMRIEMKSANKGASNLSASSTLRGSSHTPLHAPAHTYNRNHTASAPDSRTYSPGALLHHAKPELSRYAKIEPRSVPTVARTPPVAGAYERNDSGDVGSVLAAATDVTKLANFGKSRRTANAVSRTPSADAAMNSSVLPARTLMRRQRRMLSQHSEDKPEDALERLNRLKARISASLSEVKGVLKHYSVDEGDESQALTSATAKKTPSAETLPKAKATTTSLKQTASVESADLIKPVAANKASQSSSAVRDDVEKQVQSEPPKDEGPVVFRFLKIVRRRSFFNEDDDVEQPKTVEIKADTRSAEEKSNAEQIGAVSNHKMDEKETRGGVNQHEDHIKQDEASDKNVQKNDDRTEADRKDITQAQGQNKAEESSAVEHKTVDEAYKTANQALEADKLKVNEVTNEPKKNQEAPTTGGVVKTRKRSSLTKKNDARRASIAAVEASKIEPPLIPEAALDVKLQRCPSDSEAVLKKKAAAVKSLTSKKAEANNATKLHLPESSANLPNAAEMLFKPPVEVTNQLPSKPGVELDTVKEEKSSDQSEEFSTVSKAKEAKNEAAASQETETEATAKPKRRLSTRTKDSTRRASIAAVEGSRIEPPVEPSTPLNAKTQRRPSDPEAIIKRKAFAASGQTRVKIITKVKRPSVKSNTSAVAPTTTTAVAVSANETTLVNETSAAVVNNSNKDAVSQISKSTTKAAAFKKATMTTTTQPTVTATAATNNTATPAPLPKQLAIDEASLSIAEAPQPSTSPTDDHTAATKDSRLATKLDEQSGAMVATLASPLRASEQSGQVSAATQLQQLAELVGETLIVIPARNRKDETAVKQVGTRGSESSTAAERADGAVVPVKTEAPIAVIPKIPEILATPTTSPQPPADVEKPIHQEKIPTNAVQVRATSEQVSGVDRERAPKVAVVADTSITPRTATGGDCTKASATPSSSISVDEHSVASTPATATESAMPELQVVPAPVKAVQVFGETDATPPFNVPKDDYAPKKVTIKKFVRRNSIEKALAKQKSIEKAAEAQSQKKIVSDSVTVSNDVQPKPHAAIANEAVTAIVAGDEAPAVDEPSAPAPPPKKARKVRKKVIIKRQQRKLSITDAFFKEPEPSEAELPAVETLEKPIEYVTDEDEDNAENVEPEVEPVKPLKSCLRQREYQIGDWVLYGERFKKTQIRWKKGTIVERITSISYKIDIDGNEVSAHISYIKKYTSRKVKFSGKEYLEIDYEQIAEEEKRARTYSIWNMV